MMRRFVLHRLEDKTGISGTGHVAEGVIFSNGKVTLSWQTYYTSVGVYDSIDHVEAIHGHQGQTIIEYLDPEPVETDSEPAL